MNPTFESIILRQNSSGLSSASVVFSFVLPIRFQERVSVHSFLDDESVLANSMDACPLSAETCNDVFLRANANESSNVPSNEPSSWMREISLILMLSSLFGLTPVEFLLVRRSSGSDRNDDASFFDLD